MTAVIEHRPAGERAVTQDEGRTTWHSFSFGAHYDPANTGFAALVAHNDEQLPPGTGYPDHPHRDLEIVTWVISGALRHTSSVGSGVLRPGQAQRLRAGSGVVHSEVADATSPDAEPTRFLQAWVRPDEPDLVPAYDVVATEPGPGWRLVAGAEPGAPLPIATRGASLRVADLAAGARLALPEAPALHVFVAQGRVLLGERVLQPGDAARLWDEGGRALVAEQASHLVVWAFTAPGSRSSLPGAVGVRGSAPRG